MSWYRVYRSGAKCDGLPRMPFLKDFDTYEEAQTYADSQEFECVIDRIIDNSDEWEDLHPSRTIEI